MPLIEFAGCPHKMETAAQHGTAIPPVEGCQLERFLALVCKALLKFSRLQALDYKTNVLVAKLHHHFPPN